MGSDATGVACLSFGLLPGQLPQRRQKGLPLQFHDLVPPSIPGAPPYQLVSYSKNPDSLTISSAGKNVAASIDTPLRFKNACTTW